MPSFLVRCLALTILLTRPVFADSPIVRFESQEIAKDLSIGYAVAIADINEDQKPDIVVVDKHRVLWYENPTWKPRLILQGKTRPDNVCLCLLDIDGDKHLDIVLGADWKPFNTSSGGTLQWLKRGKTLDEEWTMYPIGEEPMVHRVHVADIDGDGKQEFVMVPLMGRQSTQRANWMDGRPVRVLGYKIPADPIKGPWKPEVLSESLHVVHNFCTIATKAGPDALYCASYEGVTLLEHRGDQWSSTRVGAGNQSNPMGSRGASEIKVGRLGNGSYYVATIEPWHGNQVVVYSRELGPDGLMKRVVIDEELRWGHAVWCADLDGDGKEELIIGVRDNPARGDKHTLKCGVRVYKFTDDKGEKWIRQVVDNGGVAVEDLAAADLDGDGRVDLVAVGRATRNMRIYWNKGK